MVDLHCHLLPAIDDGPVDMEGTVALGRALVEDGVQTVAATPHFRYDYPAVDAQAIAGRCAQVRAALQAAQVPLDVVTGAEVDLNAALQADGAELRSLSLGGRGDILLVETPYGPLSRSFEDLLFRGVSLHGLRVLLAHPERSPSFQKDPRRLEALAERGVLLQITAGALLRPRRSRSRRLATTLIERGVAHVLASDAHSATSGRRPQMRAALRAAGRIAPGYGDWMTGAAPSALLAGQPLPAPVHGRSPRRGLLGRRLDAMSA
jgi:protein-tyrosine phosphatase